MVDVLRAIDTFCSDKGLRYCLAWGTLLGAVRHNGFIPWDDDIDVWMPRPDYDRFIDEFRDDKYEVLCSSRNEDYPLDFAKLHDSRTIVEEDGGDGKWGVFVDIFPLDGVPDHDRGVKLFKKVRAIRRLVANQRFTYKFKPAKDAGFAKNVSIVLGKVIHPFVSLNKVLLAEDKVMKSYDYDGCPLCMDLCDARRPLIFDKDLFRNVEPIPFEDGRFLAPVEYDRILTMLYGDYMQLPPEEKRVSNHGLKAYWKNL